MIQFFAPDLLSTGQLPQDESRHCAKVLRHKAGDEICVVDGAGRRYTCRILDPDPRGTQLEILSFEEIPTHWGASVTLVVAPTKNMDRMEWMTEKAVEMGVDRIIPVLCDHSERKVVKTERLVNIAVSAMKQSLKTTLPEVLPLTPFSGMLEIVGSDTSQKFMGYCDARYPRLPLITQYRPGSDATLLIGPEGDFSPAEVEMAVDTGFVPVTFGLSRLRTETAAIVALDTIHLLNYQKECAG